MLNKIFLTILSNSAEKFVLRVQQFSKPDTRKHHTMKSVHPIVAMFDVSYFPKDKIQLEANWFDQLTSNLFCFTMIIISPLPSPDTCPLLITPPKILLLSCISKGLIAGILWYLTFVSLLRCNGSLRKFSLL